MKLQKEKDEEAFEKSLIRNGLTIATIAFIVFFVCLSALVAILLRMKHIV